MSNHRLALFRQLNVRKFSICLETDNDDNDFNGWTSFGDLAVIFGESTGILHHRQGYYAVELIQIIVDGIVLDIPHTFFKITEDVSRLS